MIRIIVLLFISSFSFCHQATRLYLFSILNHMKKFIIRTLLIVLPFFISGYVYKSFYDSEMGGFSIRVGHFSSGVDSFKIISKLNFETTYFDYLSETKKTEFKVLNIGNSFSKQEFRKINGYTNYLAVDDTISLLNHIINVNPAKRLKEILNSTVLDSIKVEYIILQFVERHFTSNLNHIGKLKKINYNKLKILDKKNCKQFKEKLIVDKKYPGFFSKGTLFFGLNEILNKDLKGLVLKSKTKHNLFSINRNEIIFYHEDISNLEINNNPTLIEEANKELNSIALRLKQKDVKLIVLIAPDKYSFYYNDLLDNKYPEPILFDVLDTLSKDYLYFNSKKLLSERKQITEDLYFFDDTHWSPLASKIIADKLRKIILE